MNEAAQSKKATESVVISLLDEGSTTPVKITMTPALAGVLARSAAVNEKRDGFDLSFSSMVVGVVTGADPTCKWMRRYFTDQRVPLQYLYKRIGKPVSRVEALARAKADPANILNANLVRTSSVRRALDEAQTIAVGHGHGRSEPLHVRHLVAALIALRDYHTEDYSALGIDRPQLSAAFVGHISQLVPEESEHWRRFHERAFPDHPLPAEATATGGDHRAEYDADAYTKVDLLDINDEVRALSYIIASKETKPPLSIGLFGDWGSGKTFFMKHLRRHIELLSSRAAGATANETTCYPYIAQIEFNAWHYQDGDLWASLVDHILRNLRFGENENESKLRERRDDVVKQLAESESRLDTASTRAEEAEAKVADAETNLANLQDKQRKTQERLAKELAPAQVLEAVRLGFKLDENQQKEVERLLAAVGVTDVGKSAMELQAAVADAKRELGSFRGLLMPILHSENRTWRIVALAAALITPLVVGLALRQLSAAGLQETIAQVASVLGGVATFVGTAAMWINNQAKWIRGIRAQIEPVSRQLDDHMRNQIEKLTFEQGQNIAKQMEELQRLKEQETAERQKRSEAVAEVEALRSQTKAIDDESLFRNFLDTRLKDGDYQKRLGLAALVRRDFERISAFVERANKGETKPNETTINRIVLYVDDLDRCTEDKVVEVLRAVHLLLAFRGFVVVVGVDSRWVAHCLKSSIKMFVDVDSESDDGTRATPLDYLEKIFQIPIWLEPMSSDLRAGMAKKLLSRSSGNGRGPFVAPEAPRQGATNADPPDTIVPSPSETEGTAVNTANVEEQKVVEGHDTIQETDDEPIELSPAALVITEEEVAFVEQLKQLLSPSPRVLKRFVNTYRLFKATQPEEYTQQRPPGPQDYQICMFLLAVLVGMPELSKVLQTAIKKGGVTYLNDLDNPIKTVSGNTKNIRADRDWEKVMKWLEAQGISWTHLPGERLATWLPRVGRYTFNLDRSGTAQ